MRRCKASVAIYDLFVIKIMVQAEVTLIDHRWITFRSLADHSCGFLNDVLCLIQSLLCVLHQHLLIYIFCHCWVFFTNSPLLVYFCRRRTHAKAGKAGKNKLSFLNCLITSLKLPNALSKFSAISSANTSGSGRLSKLASDLSFSHVIFKDVLSRSVISS